MHRNNSISDSSNLLNWIRRRNLFSNNLIILKRRHESTSLLPRSPECLGMVSGMNNVNNFFPLPTAMRVKTFSCCFKWHSNRDLCSIPFDWLIASFVSPLRRCQVVWCCALLKSSLTIRSCENLLHPNDTQSSNFRDGAASMTHEKCFSMNSTSSLGGVAS